MKEEFKKKHKLNAMFLESRKSFGSGPKDAYVTQEDYRSNPDLVIPAADPNIVSDTQRLNQANMVLQASHGVPGFSVPEAVKRWLKALKVEGIDTLYPGPDKVPPLPNPKAAVEQLKLSGVQMKIEADKQKFLMELLAAKTKTQAEIVKIYAEVGKLLAETQTEQVKAKVEAFTAMVEAFKTHNDMLTQQIEAQTGGKDGGDKAGAMGGVEAQPGNPGVPAQVPAPSPSGANGAMGGAAVPG
jgi:hypothetical protein